MKVSQLHRGGRKVVGAVKVKTLTRQGIRGQINGFTGASQVSRETDSQVQFTSLPPLYKGVKLVRWEGNLNMLTKEGGKRWIQKQ